jgi:hypothetical protein
VKDGFILVVESSGDEIESASAYSRQVAEALSWLNDSGFELHNGGTITVNVQNEPVQMVEASSIGCVSIKIPSLLAIVQIFVTPRLSYKLESARSKLPTRHFKRKSVRQLELVEKCGLSL